jgi:hypothetical protein
VVIDPERNTARAYLGALSGPPQPLPELARHLAAGDLAQLHRDVAAEAVATIAGLDAVDRRMHAGTLLRALERALAQ